MSQHSQPVHKTPLQADQEGLQRYFEEHTPGLQLAFAPGYGANSLGDGSWPEPVESPQQPHQHHGSPDGKHGEGAMAAGYGGNTATVTPGTESLPWAKAPSTTTGLGSAAHDANPLVTAADGRARRRKKMFVIAGIVGAIVVIGAVLGGVLGTQLNKAGGQKDSGSNLPPDGGSGTTMTANAAEMTGTSTVIAAYAYPTAISWGAPHLEVFALTKNQAASVHRRYRNSNATSPTDLVPSSGGGSMEPVGGSVDYTRTPAIAIQSNPRAAGNGTELLIVSANGTLLSKGHGGSMIWSGANDPDNWNTPGAGVSTAVSSPAFAPHRDLTTGELDAFVLSRPSGSSKTQMAHLRFDGQRRWDAPVTLTSPDLLVSVPPRAVSWGGRRVDVFAVDRATRHLQHAFTEGVSSGWATPGVGVDNVRDLGGYLTSAPAVVSRAAGVIDVFARGGDGRLWQRTYLRDSGGWGISREVNWTLAGSDVEILAEPDAISWHGDRIDLFAWGSKGSALLHRVYTVKGTGDEARKGTFTPAGGWNVVALGISGPPKAVSDMAGRMHVFAYGNGTDLVWRTWTDQAGWQGEVSVFAQVP